MFEISTKQGPVLACVSEITAQYSLTSTDYIIRRIDELHGEEANRLVLKQGGTPS